MFLIDADAKKATSLKRMTFAELGFTERNDLQEWICGNPDILGEPLLIIQKEFSGFSDTNERLDLLGLDKRGNLVIIENKLDDSGRDVVWQALKYASYCATSTKNEIRDMYQAYLGSSGSATELICGFLAEEEFDSVQLNSGEPRIILAAANFRKEVTTTVLFLNDHQLDIKCIRVTPYQDSGRLYLDAEQILPVQDAGDYQIRISAKRQDDVENAKSITDTQKLRVKFWETAIPIVAEKVPELANKTPSRDSWLGFKYHGVEFNLNILRDSARVELFVSGGDRERTEAIFRGLLERRNELEAAFGGPLEWQEKAKRQDAQSAKIFLTFTKHGLVKPENWATTINWLTENIEKLYFTFKGPLDSVLSSLPAQIS